MDSPLAGITYDIRLGDGEPLSLPIDAQKILGPGHWLVTIQPADESPSAPRSHAAFLNSYTAGDEGLYDDYSAG